MGNINNRRLQSLMQFGNLNSHLHTQFRIQIRKRFIHQEYFRFTNNRTPHSHTLSLTTGQKLRFSVEKMFNIKNSCSFSDSSVNLIFRHLAQLQAKCHIIINRHMRIKSITLEHHCDISVFRFNIIDQFVINVEFTFGYLLKACDHTKCC